MAVIRNKTEKVLMSNDRFGVKFSENASVSHHIYVVFSHPKVDYQRNRLDTEETVVFHLLHRYHHWEDSG